MSARYESGGAQLSYKETGSGTPVVFLHPTPLDHEYWRPLVQGRGAPIRAILPDFRGHGDSELASGPALPVGGFARVPDAPVLSMAQLAGDVLALLDGLEIREAIFVGCSIGGYVMLELWRQAPERMRALAFLCSKPQADGEAALAKRAENIQKARSSGVGSIFDAMAQSLLGATARRTTPAIVQECRSRMTLTTEAFVAVQAGLATRPDSLATVETMRVPVLAIAGGEDTAIPAAEMEAFRGAPGGCEFHLVADAGHFAAYERPEQVAPLVNRWVSSLGTSLK